VLIGGGAWLVSGPLRPGWSLHAGLPALTHEQTSHQARDLVQAWDGVHARDGVHAGDWLGAAAGRAGGARAAGLSWTSS
jgi:hypothetical protein